MRSFIRVILATLLFALAALPALAESYRLLPQDRLSVRAMRWDPLSASYMIWDGVSGEFALAGDGTLMFPLVKEYPQGWGGGKPTGLLPPLEEWPQRSRTDSLFSRPAAVMLGSEGGDHGESLHPTTVSAKPQKAKLRTLVRPAPLN